MKYWPQKYIGGKWTNEKDCLGWFVEIQRNEFGRELPPDLVPPGTSGACAAMRMMGTDIGDRAGWIRAKTIKDGDALFLSQGRTRPHHLGVAAVINGKVWVVHALEGGVGVVCSTLAELRQNFWEVKEIWTCG